MGCICFKGRREDGDTTTFSNSLIDGEMPCQQRPTYNPQSTFTAQDGSMVIAPAINSTVGRDLNFNIFAVFEQSRDCPIFYMRKKLQKDLDDQEKLVSRFGW